MSQPNGEAATTVAQVKAITENADRLGLTWTLRPGTVSVSSPLTVIMDGDSVAIDMFSMCGTVFAGERVWVISVPPSGNYVVGRMTAPYRARQTLDAASSTVTFSNIPTNLARLILRWNARGDAVANTRTIALQVNGSASAVYSSETIQGNNATVTTAATAGATSIIIGIMTAASAAANIFGSGRCEMVSWDGTTGSLGLIFESQALGTGVANFFKTNGGGVYGALGPFTSLTLTAQSGNFIAGSDFQLEGE